MSVLHTDEAEPQLFEFIDRAQSGLPEHFLSTAKEVAVAGPDLIRELEDYSGSYKSWGWIAGADGTSFQVGYVDRVSPDQQAVLVGIHIEQRGEFWYIRRYIDGRGYQVLVVAFEYVPICTRTFRDAIRLAEHCHPVTRAPMPGCWVNS